MKAHQPPARFNLAAPAMNKCTLMLTAGTTAMLARFYNSANVSPFIKQFGILMLFFPAKIICAFGIPLDCFSIEISHAINGVLKDRLVTE